MQRTFVARDQRVAQFVAVSHIIDFLHNSPGLDPQVHLPAKSCFFSIVGVSLGIPLDWEKKKNNVNGPFDDGH